MAKLQAEVVSAGLPKNRYGRYHLSNNYIAVVDLHKMEVKIDFIAFSMEAFS